MSDTRGCCLAVFLRLGTCLLNPTSGADGLEFIVPGTLLDLLPKVTSRSSMNRLARSRLPRLTAQLNAQACCTAYDKPSPA